LLRSNAGALIAHGGSPRRKRVEVYSNIELDIDGVRVRIGDGAKASIVSAVIRALKATS
jgi:hypothetical protein